MRTIIDSSIWRSPGNIYGFADSLLIRERDSSAQLRELLVIGVPQSAICIDLDPAEGISSGKKARLGRYSWFFSTSHQIATKQCDGGIYCEINGASYLFLIELKSSASGLSRGRQQLLSGVAFSCYLEKLLGKPMNVCTRLIYVGPATSAPAIASSRGFAPSAVIPTRVVGGRASLSFHELAR